MAHSNLERIPQAKIDWEKCLAFFDKPESQSRFTHNEQKSINALVDFLKYEDFNKAKREELIGRTSGLGKYFLYHKNNMLGEMLREFSRLCVDFIFTDAEVFKEFQKELGGKRSKDDRKKKEEDDRKRKQEEDDRRRKQEEENRKRKQEEDDRRRKQEEDDRKQKQKKRKQKEALMRTCLFAAAFIGIILILYFTFPLHSAEDKDEKTEQVNSPAADTQDLIAGTYSVKCKIDGQITDRATGSIEVISKNEYRVTIRSDYGPESFLLNFDGRIAYATDIQNIEIINDGDHRQIKIIFTKNNQIWEFTKESLK
ncbi:MAG: hypothetical protein LBC98_04235 [Prevotellaceae bacterium]|jgi:flagellar motor protein MotB|nr:hypothetical protein [Prevotellaceae bacterium]